MNTNGRRGIKLCALFRIMILVLMGIGSEEISAQGSPIVNPSFELNGIPINLADKDLTLTSAVGWSDNVSGTFGGYITQSDSTLVTDRHNGIQIFAKTGSLTQGAIASIWQDVDLTGIQMLSFDVRSLHSSTSQGAEAYLAGFFLNDVSQWSTTSGDNLTTVVEDTSQLNGVNRLEFRLTALTTGFTFGPNQLQIDNLRTSPSMAPIDNPTFANLVYNWTTGSVRIEPTTHLLSPGSPPAGDGGQITSFGFTPASGQLGFNAPGIATFPDHGFRVDYPDDIGWFDLTTPITSPVDLGQIFPPGFRTVDELNDYLDDYSYIGAPNTGLRGFDLIIVPEPSTVILLVGAWTVGYLFSRRFGAAYSATNNPYC